MVTSQLLIIGIVFALLLVGVLVAGIIAIVAIFARKSRQRNSHQ